MRYTQSSERNGRTRARSRVDQAAQKSVTVLTLALGVRPLGRLDPREAGEGERAGARSRQKPAPLVLSL
jgi:hypothetical protein